MDVHLTRARGVPVVLDWMSGVRLLLPPINFDCPPYCTDGLPDFYPALGSKAYDCVSPLDVTDETLSSSLPLSFDSSFHTISSLDQDLNCSEDPYAISPSMHPEHLITQSFVSADARSQVADDGHHGSRRAKPGTAGTQQKDGQNLRCWDHGCNGHVFTTLSNLKRHQREKSSSRPSYPCTMCGAIFSRTTARNHHIQNKSCNRIRRYSNGRQRANTIGLKPATSIQLT